MQSLDILYLTLSVCITLLTVFVSITLIYLLFILRDVVKVTDQVKDLVEKVNTYITKPILLTKSIIEFVSPFIQSAQEKVGKKRRD
ncbi:hypothetical protein IPG41_00865 [Candidatus Peregrinibacteria bacterium]|nr:MAG: hypothetical protein IPG41_00865 [Candidatus Peregrinibacteria bacterium]